MLTAPNPDSLSWQGHPPPVVMSGDHQMADGHQPGGPHPPTRSPQTLANS